ncbi:hypothetical protein BGX33_002837 [Mortierella sp. NVP41]|nr:hypothetical protein BGX33_002837 [Mortierella sp. NVP41]
MIPTLNDFRSEGIREPLTNRIKGILDEYPDGTQIARELLQNSDDARSTVQWYLLDHRDHRVKHNTPSGTRLPQGQSNKLRLFHDNLEEYMGPALLAGNDSVFEEKDFVSLKNLAASEKRSDESKIGQMGIGFNSIYHLTDCPSFITGDQLMIIEPHERVFNGRVSEFKEGAVRGSFLSGNQGVDKFPDQLKSFAVVEDIDFSKPYPGTIFRFPLRAEEQAATSALSNYAYTPAKVLEMLVKLKDEALKALLFLKHVERIIIYERKVHQDRPAKLFEIEIVNAEEVRKERLRLLGNLKSHVYPYGSVNQENVLTYSVRPTYKITQDDGSTTEETWHINTLVGNVVKSREYMKARTDGNISSHKLIPWVGIAAPMNPNVKIDTSRLFCFLPIGIQLPFPVHVNGHFAVKQSRREIWTNQDNDFSTQASANIKSLWNVHLFEKQIPEAYALFLENVALDHGANYDLWPIHCGEGIGLDAIWKDLLRNVVEAIIVQDRKVFICGSKDDQFLEHPSAVYFAGSDIDQFPLLKESLHKMVYLAEGVPGVILKEIADLKTPLGGLQDFLTPALVRGILSDNKEEWTSTADTATRVEMMRYCLLDNDVSGLEGLPLLPLHGGIWAEFALDKADKRYYVPRIVFETLTKAGAGVDLVDLNARDFPFDQIIAASNDTKFWSPMQPSPIAERIRLAYDSNCYQGGVVPAGCISQMPEQFPSDEWLQDFWNMAHSLSERRDMFSGLAGIHLFPAGGGQLAPFSTERRVVYLNKSIPGNVGVGVIEKVSSILEQYLGCSVLRPWFGQPGPHLKQFVVDMSDVPGILDLFSKKTDGQLEAIAQADRMHLARYLKAFLKPTATISEEQRRLLRRLPVYKGYDSFGLASLVTLDTASSSTTTTKSLRLAQGYTNSEHPWIPQSIDLLADDQPMKELLCAMLDISVLSESEYWFFLVSHISERDETEWDAIMSRLGPVYHVHSKAFDLASALRKTPFVSTITAPELLHLHNNKALGLGSLLHNLPFIPKKSEPEFVPPENCVPVFLPPSPQPRRRSPESLVHHSLAAYFLEHETVFPTGIYAEAPLSGILSELGMRSAFDAALVQERIQTLFEEDALTLYNSVKDEGNRKLVMSLYGRMNSDFSESFLTPELCHTLKAVKWVCIGEYQWRKTPHDCRPKSDYVLVGDCVQHADYTFTNEVLLRCLGWSEPPPLHTVLSNLISIVDKHAPRRSANNNNNSSGGGAVSQSKKRHQPWRQQPQEQSVDISSLDMLPIYRYLAGKIKDSESLKEIKSKLRNRPWILISGAFYWADRVALNMHCDLQPHFVQAPSTAASAGLEDLFLALGVREHVRQEDIEGILATVGSRYEKGQPLLKSDADLVYRLLTAIAYAPDSKWSADILILTEDGSLRGAADVVYNDVNARQTTDSRTTNSDVTYTFAHRRISYEMADRLRIPMFSTRSWDDSMDNSFDPFCQQENIVDRIRGILNDYDPSSIFNEFLQNASDAGASECHFWLETRQFGREKCLSKEMADWQGPALMVYNDAEFSEKDFEALCKLGVGNKRQDTSKIGRHGLGFNSVYHFTDVPSIVSGPYIGFFDPHMRNLPKSRDRNGKPIAKGGHRCDFRKLNTETLADQLEPYKGFLGCDMRSHFKGTLFRLPLRMEGSESGFGGDGWKVEQIQKMMEGWVEDAKVGMLFLRNITTIRISDGSKPQVTIIKKPTETVQPSSVPLFDIQEWRGDRVPTGTTTWLVVCEDRFPLKAPPRVQQIATRNQWAPQRGVAIHLTPLPSLLLPANRLIAHLPTPILTDLPFQIHGDFALTSNRKNLAGGTEEENEKLIWNSFLIGTCLPETALLAMEHLLKVYFTQSGSLGSTAMGVEKALAQYFLRWPTEAAKGFEPFLTTFSRSSWDKNVFPCRSTTLRKDKLMAATNGLRVTLPGTIAIPSHLASVVRPWFINCKENVCLVPYHVLSPLDVEWKSAGFVAKRIDGDFIRRRLLDSPTFIQDSIKSKQDQEWILGWALQPITSPKIKADTPAYDLTVIPLRNGQWKRLTGDGIYYIASRHERELLAGKKDDMLVDDDVYSSKELQRALQLLLQDKIYGIQLLPEALFSCWFFKENPPNRITDAQREKLWDYLEEEYNGLEHFSHFPILRTSFGTWTTLDKAQTGMQISDLPSDTITRRRIEACLDLLHDLGVVVFDAAENRNHVYFRHHCPQYSDSLLITTVQAYWQPQSSTFRKFTDKEAEAMREMIIGRKRLGDRGPAWALGKMPIWCPHGPAGTPLTRARGSLYLDGSFSLENLGSFPNVIQDSNSRLLKEMGAKPLKIAVAMTDHVLPKFHSGAVKCEGVTKAAYLCLLANLMAACQLQGKRSRVPRNVVNNSRCYLTRAGTFRTLAELMSPLEALTQVVFADRPDLFPDEQLNGYVRYHFQTTGPRSLSSTNGLLAECAEKVLAETADPTADAETTRTMAARLVKYIYENPTAGGVNWVDTKWKFVPRETNLAPPYNLMAPDLPLYMPFAELVDPRHRDFIWTQVGFFPADLPPSSEFMTKYPLVGGCYLNDTFRHLNTLVKHIAPTWKSTEQQLALKAILFKIYSFCEGCVARDKSWRDLAVQEVSQRLKVPYILNGNDKDPSKASSWIWPAQLMFDIDNSIPSHQVVHPILHQYRTFLVAAGAEEMVHVEGTVQVEDGRKLGDMETQVMNCFEAQDQETGFMDVRFKFQEGADILAHKVVLARASQFFFRRFTGVWALSSTRSLEDPGVEIIDLSGYGEIRTGFWGLLYYFYSDTLIQSNGPPVFQDAGEGSLNEGDGMGGEGSDQEDDDDDPDHPPPPSRPGLSDDKLSQRVQYLMTLQDVANRFEASRLKNLIAQELIMGQKVIHSNVFSVRGHAEHNQAENVREYCDKFIAKNKSSVIKYVTGEIRVLREDLEALGRREAQEEDEDDEDGDYEPSESEKEENDGDGEDEADQSKDGNDADEIFAVVGGKLKGLDLDQDKTGGMEEVRGRGDDDWEDEESAEWTCSEDDWDSSSGSVDDDDEEEKVDAIGYLNKISPLRASLEEDLLELEENLKELLASSSRSSSSPS